MPVRVQYANSFSLFLFLVVSRNGIFCVQRANGHYGGLAIAQGVDAARRGAVGARFGVHRICRGFALGL